jgi:methylmalonyl-CoA mutase
MTKSGNNLRILTAVPICDGHDSAINTVNLELIRNGVEVIYLGYHRSVRDVVRAAVQEDVRAVGISSYNSGHVEFFTEVVAGLRKQVGDAITVFGGGGGTITREDARIMQRRGVDRIFFAGTSLDEIVGYVKSLEARRPALKAGGSKASFDLGISLKLRAAGVVGASPAGPPTIGITGPGGAGKTTLIDELVLRYLHRFPTKRVAILSHDPSIVGNGALLGDRATMIHSQHDRVFMRSLATRGRAGGLSPQTEPMLAALRRLPFDLIILETVGTGQEAMPFSGGLVDRSLFVMSPEYGSKLQLQKIAMLDVADVVVVNKGDLAGAPRAAAEVEQRLHLNRREQSVFTTQAKRHRDHGVDALFESLIGQLQRQERPARPPRPTRKSRKTKLRA